MNSGNNVQLSITLGNQPLITSNFVISSTCYNRTFNLNVDVNHKSSFPREKSVRYSCI